MEWLGLLQTRKTRHYPNRNSAVAAAVAHSVAYGEHCIFTKHRSCVPGCTILHYDTMTTMTIFLLAVTRVTRETRLDSSSRFASAVLQTARQNYNGTHYARWQWCLLRRAQQRVAVVTGSQLVASVKSLLVCLFVWGAVTRGRRSRAVLHAVFRWAFVI